MKRIFAAVLAAVAMFAAGEAQAQKKTIVIGMGSADAGKLDPHIASTTPDKGLLQYMFNGLVRIRPGQISPDTIEPDLAESWTSNPNGTEWTFKIRQGVQCHSGYGEFTAEDAAYSLKRAANKATSSYSNDFSSVDKAEAVDKYTLKITLKNPVAGFLGYVANVNGGNQICKKAAEELGENFSKKPIGTGPFMFAEYQPQQFVKLVANKQYFRGAPKLDRIVYRYIPSDASRDLAYQSGEIDLIYGTGSQTWVDRMKGLPNTDVMVFEPAELTLLNLNITKPPLDNLKVRQAFAYAINRDEVVKFVGAAVARAGKSVVPIGYLGYSDDVPLIPFDLNKSKELLKEAGFPNGVTLKAVQTNLPGMLHPMEVVQAQLRRAGINLEFDVVEHATFHANIRKDLSQVVEYTAARFPVADTYLTQFFHSAAIVGTPTAVTNFSHCNMADQEIEAARSEPDAAKQKALWKTAQQKLMYQVCAVPLHEALLVWAKRSNLDLGYKLEGDLSLGPAVIETTQFR
ncbi:MAG: polyamine ABC transporter substrate-binding protein [Hyphomicrobiales bacterium]|nr:polyamine ABC transporter substrate-binding protein [Hyphomicrobiales bacterium]